MSIHSLNKNVEDSVLENDVIMEMRERIVRAFLDLIVLMKLSEGCEPLGGYDFCKLVIEEFDVIISPGCDSNACPSFHPASIWIKLLFHQFGILKKGCGHVIRPVLNRMDLPTGQLGNLIKNHVRHVTVIYFRESLWLSFIKCPSARIKRT